MAKKQSVVGGLQIEEVAIESLVPDPRNPRVMLQPGDEGYAQLGASLERFGLTEPLVWNKRTGYLVSGHQRLQLLRDRGVTHVPVSIVDLSPEDGLALGLAMNKVEGEWDKGKLKDVLDDLSQAMDLAGTGFTVVDLAQLTAELAMPTEDIAATFDEPFEPSLQPAVAKSDITEKDVKKAEKAQSEKFGGHREPKDITCPHCSQTFGIGGWLQDYVEETEKLQAEAKG